MTDSERIKLIREGIKTYGDVGDGPDVCFLLARVDKLEAALRWYAEWDWSDKYVEPVHKRAREALGEE